MTNGDLAIDPEPGSHIAELSIAARRLIEVHKVHVDQVPRQVTVKLRVQVQDRPYKNA